MRMISLAARMSYSGADLRFPGSGNGAAKE
jgi:hypothetical protein